MIEEPTTVDGIMALLIVFVIVLAALWTQGFYERTYNPPPDTLPSMEQP